MKPSEVPDALMELACARFTDAPVEPGVEWVPMRRALAAVLPEHERQVRAKVAAAWTKEAPDRQIGVIRLSCGHAKIWRRHLPTGVIDMSGWRTLCWHCGEVGVEREIARGGA